MHTRDNVQQVINEQDSLKTSPTQICVAKKTQQKQYSIIQSDDE
jgi:hypothetical protein